MSEKPEYVVWKGLIKDAIREDREEERALQWEVSRLEKRAYVEAMQKLRNECREFDEEEKDERLKWIKKLTEKYDL